MKTRTLKNSGVRTVWKVAASCTRWTPDGYRTDSFRSVSIQTNSRWCLRYEIGKTTRPKPGSFLFAFRTEDHAKLFIGRTYRVALLECRALIAPRRLLRTRFNGLLWLADPAFPENLRRFWKQVAKNKFNIHAYDTIGVPEGSVLCRWIKPIRRVNPRW